MFPAPVAAALVAQRCAERVETKTHLSSGSRPRRRTSAVVALGPI
jgi:hypothetical protein